MKKRAQLFATCLVNDLYPDVGFAVARVLKKVGWSLDVPGGQVCCGQPGYNAGFPEEARRVARATLRAFAGGEGPLIVPSGSCGDFLKHHLPELFPEDDPDHAAAQALSARVREFSQFLVDDLQAVDLGARASARVAYHPSCHLLRGLGVKEQPQALLGAVRGVELVPFTGQEDCCGFGGAFSETHAPLSGRMLSEKLGHLAQAGPDTLVSADLGCLMHLEGGLRRRGQAVKVRHLAQFLAEALP